MDAATDFVNPKTGLPWLRTRRCKQCVPHTDHNREWQFCPDHGQRLSDYMLPSCPKCWRQVESGEHRFCVHCGEKLEEQ